MKSKIILFLLATVLLLTSSLSLFASVPKDELQVKAPLYKINSFIEKESNYHYFIEHSVQFKTVDFTLYTIKQGDNFWKIAKRFGINIDTLIAANPHWESLLARTGQKVVIPSKKGSLLFISPKDSVDQIAEFFGKELTDIEVQYVPNYYKFQKMYGAHPLPIAVFVHGAKPSVQTMTQKMGHQYTLREMFRSPLGGRFSSFFGSRKHPIFKKRKFHNGVDIAAKRGTYIGAACDGKVIAAGWMGGFGKAVIVQHKDGYKTLYGHMSKISTKQGAYVKQGQLIGRVGSTGYSTGPHLHFTLWHNGQLINPMKVLW